VDCIFVVVPRECSFILKSKCSAPENHILTCARDHKRLILRENAREILIDTFTRCVVDSPYRIKIVPGQDGRDISSH